MIYGNIDGIRKSALDELESLYKAKTPKDEVCSLSIMETISRVSSFIEREISVAIDRRGNTVSVAIGDSTSVEIPTLDIREKKLAGVRIIHTHPNGFSNLSALDISALLKLKLDAIVAIGIYEGKIIDCSLGMLTVMNDTLDYEEEQHIKIEDLTSINILNKIAYIDSMIKERDIIEDEIESAILVGSDTKESLEELKELRALGYDGITIGVETGDDESLTFMNKGFQSKDVLEQCRKLDEAGISYNFFYLTGIYGAGRGEVGAKKTVMLFNQLNPKIIESSMLTIYKTSELYQEIQKGNWKEESEIEKLIELKTLVENLTINTRIVTDGASNLI